MTELNVRNVMSKVKLALNETKLGHFLFVLLPAFFCILDPPLVLSREPDGGGGKSPPP